MIGSRFCACLLVLFWGLVHCADYENINDVIVLDSDTFKNYVGKGNWLVLFYFKTCGRCISYSKTFIPFLREVKDWRWAVKVGAIDCQESKNLPVCQTYKADKFPSLRYFSSGSATPPGDSLPVKWDVFDSKVVLADHLVTESRLKLLRTYHENSNDWLVSSNSSTVNALIILDHSHRLGKQILSDVDPAQEDVLVKDLGSNSIIASGSYEEVNNKLKMFASVHPPEELVTTKPQTSTGPSPAAQIPVYASDIYRSLSMLLSTDISLIPEISGSSRNALKEFLEMLHKLLPASQEYKDNLLSLIQWVNAHPEFTGQQWSDMLNRTQFLLYTGPFIGCKGSKPQYRGYPCGLWTMFHMLTVQQYLLSARQSDIPPDLVAHAMNRFIPRFFSCTVCAFHFAANSANIARPGEPLLPENRPAPDPTDFTFNMSILQVLPKPPASSRDAVLWLNRVHNRVNQRLAGALSEDPHAPKVMFPPVQLCPACWALNSQGQNVLGGDPEAEEALLQFLIGRYRPSSWDLEHLSPSFYTHSSPVTDEQPTSDLVTICIISVVLTALGLLVLLVTFRFVCKSKYRSSGRRIRLSGSPNQIV